MIQTVPPYRMEPIQSTADRAYLLFRDTCVRAYNDGVKDGEQAQRRLLITRLKEYAKNGDTTQLLILAQLMEKEEEAWL